MTLERSTHEDNPVNVCDLTGTGLVSGMSNWNLIGLRNAKLELEWIKLDPILGRIPQV